MCFSAPVSFVASGVLGTTGVATLKKTRHKREIPLASMPFIFAVQQLSEGILWISDSGSSVAKIMTYVFLVFAYVFWPVYIPLSVFLIEKNRTRKKIIAALLMLGILISLNLLIFLLKNPIGYEFINSSISYITDVPYTKTNVALYVLAVCGSCMFSSHKIIVGIGIASLISLIVAMQFYFASWGSVWCFFAAILSLLIYFHFKNQTA